MLITKVFKAGDVLQIKPVTPKRGVECLDWRITYLNSGLSKDLVGAGLYGVCYQGKLVYVGSYLGRGNDPFLGNVVSTRWWAHLASLTMRGHRISIPQMTRARLLNNPPTPINPKLRKLLSAAPPEISRATGCVASLNRILFASKHWGRLGSGKPNTVLGDFSFVYVRVGKGSTKKSISQLRQQITEAEKEVIAQLCPMANNEIKWGEANDQISCEKATAVITKTLKKYVL